MALPSCFDKENAPANKAFNSSSRCVTIKSHSLQKAAKEGMLYQLDDFELAHILGEGGFGRVYLARHRSSGWIVALKVLSKFQLVEDRMEEYLKREIEIHFCLDHPNILRMYGYFYDNDNIYLILEYCHGGVLCEKLEAEGCFSEPMSARYISDLSDALIYCHSKYIAHRDIKPENILLGAGNCIKFADFGLSTRTFNSRCHTFCGTPAYMSPEMVTRSQHNKEVDTWALGVLLYEFLVGEPPFTAASVEATLERISELDIRWPRSISEDAKDLISKLLKKDPRERLPLQSIRNHPFMKKNL